MASSSHAARQSALRWLRYAFVLASNAVLVVFLLRDGVSPFEILVLAALEVLAVISLTPFIVVVHRLVTDRRRPPEPGRPPALREFLISLGPLAFLYLVMGLFPGLAWLMAEARPQGPVFLANPAFHQAAVYIGLLLLGRFALNLLEAGLGRFDESDPANLGPVLHYCVTLFAVAAGSVVILVLDLPMTTLVAFIAVRTAADLAVIRYLENNPSLTKLFKTVRSKHDRRPR